MKSKKSLIIAPALAALFVAAAGSVSGTVAWFSSVRVFSTDVAEFSVVETDGSLNCVMHAGQGTEMNGENVQVKKAKVSPAQNPVVLTHGSFNAIDTTAANNKAYVVNPDDLRNYLDKGVDGTHLVESTPVDNWLYKKDATLATKPSDTATVDVYFAVSWSMTFTYTFASDATPVGIYLDLGNSKFNNVANPSPKFVDAYQGEKNANLVTAKGFRVAFYGGIEGDNPNPDTPVAAADARNVVWGNNVPVADKTEYNPENTYAVDAVVMKDGIVYKCTDAITEKHAWNSSEWIATGEIVNAGNTYVNSLTTTAPYTNTQYVTTTAQPADYTRVNPGAEHNTWQAGERAERLCVLTPSKPTITVKCAAWYEGTDPNVVTGSAMSCLSAHINVYARALGAA